MVGNSRKKEEKREDNCFREKSTKTRIETALTCKTGTNINWVLEKNPPKQGLKLHITERYTPL